MRYNRITVNKATDASPRPWAEAMSLAIRTMWTVLAFGVASGANAQGIVKIMASGSVLNLSNFASVNPDCTSRGKTVVRIVSGPAHGSITLRAGPAFSFFPRLPNCNSRKVPGVAVMYRPERGFVGTESVSLDVIYPSGNESSPSYAILVK